MKSGETEPDQAASPRHILGDMDEPPGLIEERTSSESSTSSSPMDPGYHPNTPTGSERSQPLLTTEQRGAT